MDTQFFDDNTTVYSQDDPMVLCEALENKEVQSVVLAEIMKRMNLRLRVKWERDEPIEIFVTES